MPPEVVLGPALLEAVRQVVRDELHVAQPGAATPVVDGARSVTPPAAARRTGVPVKTVRELVRAGHITPRLRNRSAAPKQPKYLVNVDEVAAAGERLARGILAPTGAEPAGRTVDLEERAARIRAGR